MKMQWPEERRVKMLRPFFLPPGSSFGVWSHSPSPIPCLARRLPGGVGDRAPCGAAKWAQLLIYPPRLERSGLLAGPCISVGNLAEIYCPILAGRGLWEGKKKNVLFEAIKHKMNPISLQSKNRYV